MIYYICMDSGGTTTKTYALDDDGNVLYHLESGCGSPAIDLDYALKNIVDSIDKVYQHMLPNELKYIELGISGYTSIPDVSSFQKEIEEKYHVNVDIVTDAHIALHSFSDVLDSGIVVISGTGNACLGCNMGKYLITGGGGPLLNETGSCYSLVQRAVIKMKERYENLLPPSNLDKVIFDHFNYSSYEDLKRYFYLHTKTDIAGIAEIILKHKNSKEVQELLKEQALFIVNQIITQVKALKFKNKPKIGLLGGLYKDNSFLIDSIENYLKFYNIEYELVYPVDNVYKGALNLIKHHINKKG